jgi:hypothetical protein
VIALPVHEPCGVSGSGNVDPKTMAVQCEAKVNFNQSNRAQRSQGCGKVFSLCSRCGCRTVVDGAKCSACNPTGPMAKLA